MYIIRKSLAVVLVLLLFVGIIATPAYAVGKSSDGVTVSLTTDKNEYAQSETITATLTVKNTNDAAVKDVSLESFVPAGYALAEGDKAALQVDTLAAGETVTLTVRFVPEQSEKPTTGERPEEPPTDKPATDGGKLPNGDTPTIGDYSMALWVVLLVLAVTGLSLLIVKYRVWKRVLSLVLCLAMLASLIAGVPFSAEAAEGDTKTLDISTTIKVGGKPVNISAKVTYTLPDTPDPVYHTVRFDLDYENAPQIEAQQVLDGECATQPVGVERDGYKFAYWCVKTDTGVKMIDLSQPVTEDLTLYARWVSEGANSDITYTTYYNISFGIPDGYTEEDVQATIMPEDQVIHEGALVYSLPTPYREGYEYRVEHYLQQLDGSYTLQQSDKLTGYMNDTVTAQSVKFTGFTCDTANGDSILSGTVTTDGSLVLKLYYTRNSYEVKWYAYDGITLLATTQVKYRDTIIPPETYEADSTRGGYTMTGWKASDYGVVTAAGASFTTADHGLWTANPYTVTFQANGGQGTMADQSFTYDEAQKLMANGFKRPGYTFAGWSNTSTGSVAYADNEQVENLVASGNMELYAVWTAGDGYTYTVEHYVQQLDGSYTVDTTTTFSGVMDSEVTATAISIQGFVFASDHADNVLSGKINAEGTLVLKLYYDRQSYTATLVDDSGNQLASWQVQYGAAVTVPAGVAVPVREGYTFGGWAELGTMPAENMTYSVADYGSWNADSYTVIFDANGGEGEMDDQPFTYDKAQTLTSNGFTQAGYTFAGWSLDADGEVKYADREQVTNLASSGKVTLYAQWTADASAYKVVYYGENLDGTGFEEIKTEDRTGKTDSNVSATAITIEGFTYDASNSENVTSGTIAGDGSLVLKLYYTRNSYTLTLDFNGESMKQAVMDWNIGKSSIIGFDVADQTVTLKYGQTLAEALTGITVPVLTEEGYEIWDEEVGGYVEVEPVYEDMAFETAFPGYTFAAWDGIRDTMPAQELILTAQWTPITITVTFHSGYSYGYAPDVTGTAITKTYSYGDSILIPEHDFVWSEHTITGWKLGDGSGGFGQYPDIYCCT